MDFNSAFKVLIGNWNTPSGGTDHFLSVLQESSDLLSKQESRRRAKRKAWKESRQGQTSVPNGESACTEVQCAGIGR